MAKVESLQKVIAFICEKPLRNIRSERFLRKKGFRRIEELVIEDQVVLGVYKLDF